MGMNKWLDKNYIDLIWEFEQDYDKGVQLCRKNNVSAFEYFNKLHNVDIYPHLADVKRVLNQQFLSVDIKTKLKESFYFLVLDKDIKGE